MTVWWLVALVSCVVAFFVVRAVVRRARERREIAAAADAELRRRAEQQIRWMQRGDRRGVFGPEGAEVMDSIAPEPELDEPDLSADYPRTAQVAHTTEDLAKLVVDKLPCWRWAAFVSVLVQRHRAVEGRLRDLSLEYCAPSGERLLSRAEVGCFVYERMDELLTLVSQAERFMLTEAFSEVFGDPGDEASADADGILHTADRLMNYHDRFLELAERCRSVTVASHHLELMQDLSQLMDVPLVAYRRFIDDFVERLGEMPEVLYYAQGVVELDPVVLHMDVDDVLLRRITKRVRRSVASR